MCSPSLFWKFRKSALLAAYTAIAALGASAVLMAGAPPAPGGAPATPPATNPSMALGALMKNSFKSNVGITRNGRNMNVQWEDVQAGDTIVTPANSLAGKAIEGKLTADADKKLLLDYMKAIAARKTPDVKPKTLPDGKTVGDAADWKARTSAMIAAAQKIVDNDPAGPAAFKAATDCKACHDVFNPP